MTQPPQPSGGGRLLNTFINRPVEDHGSGWSNLWDEGNSDLWDRGKTSPALVDVVEQERELFNPFTVDGKRKRAIVPGCGRGYEVIMLALHGFDAYGLEISTTAVKEADNYAAAEMQNPSAYHFGSRQSPFRSDSPGTATFLQGDFFSSKWESKGGVGGTTQFDLAYDYTFLCALHPTLRTQWAACMARILKGDGHGLLICLEFPLYKDPQLPGPPWGLKGVHWNLLALGGEGQVFGVVDENGKEKCASEVEAGTFRRVLYTKPARSYEVARGTDMLSVYARK